MDLDWKNEKRGFTEADLRQVIERQRFMIRKYGHRSVVMVHEAIKVLRWAFKRLPQEASK